MGHNRLRPPTMQIPSLLNGQWCLRAIGISAMKVWLSTTSPTARGGVPEVRQAAHLPRQICDNCHNKVNLTGRSAPPKTHQPVAHNLSSRSDKTGRLANAESAQVHAQMLGFSGPTQKSRTARHASTPNLHDGNRVVNGGECKAQRSNRQLAQNDDCDAAPLPKMVVTGMPRLMLRQRHFK